MSHAFENSINLKFVNISGINDNGQDSPIKNISTNGFQDTFKGCCNFKCIRLPLFDFSNCTGEVGSLSELLNLVIIRVYNSGNVFKRLSLDGEWFEYYSGVKYSSNTIPNNIDEIRKYEEIENKIYWYYENDEEVVVHLSSLYPSSENYVEGYYFSANKSNNYYLLPRGDNVDTIVLDNDIVNIDTILYAKLDVELVLMPQDAYILQNDWFGDAGDRFYNEDIKNYTIIIIQKGGSISGTCTELLDSNGLLQYINGTEITIYA